MLTRFHAAIIYALLYRDAARRFDRGETDRIDYRNLARQAWCAAVGYRLSCRERRS